MDRNSLSLQRSLTHFLVALLAEGVDRNTNYGKTAGIAARVALLAEGVDRNVRYCGMICNAGVALLAEGVDRNHIHTVKQV